MALLPTPGVFGAQSRSRALGQSLALDPARAEDGDVFHALAPDQAVVEMAVAVILILVHSIGLGGS